MYKSVGRSNDDLVSQESSKDDSEPPEGKQVKFSGSTTDISKPPLERVPTSGIPLTSHGSAKDSDEETERLKFFLGPSGSQLDVADTNRLSTRPAAREETTKEGVAERSGKDGTLSTGDNQKLQHMGRSEGQAFNEGTEHRPEGRVASSGDLTSVGGNEGQDQVLERQVREPVDENRQRTETTVRFDNEIQRNERQFLDTLSPNSGKYDEDYPHRRPVSVEPHNEVRAPVEKVSTEVVRNRKTGDTMVRETEEKTEVPVRRGDTQNEKWLEKREVQPGKTGDDGDVKRAIEPVRKGVEVVSEGIKNEERQISRELTTENSKDILASPDQQAEPVHIIVGHGRSRPKQAVTIATQVEDEELLAKTICTQVSETELDHLNMDGVDEDVPTPLVTTTTVKEVVRRPKETPAVVKEESRRSSNPVTVKEGTKATEPEVDPKRPQFHLNNDDDGTASEKNDVVDNTLRPVGSCAQLHGILRKAPSAKWGSQSTVAFDEMQPTSRANSIVGDDSANDLRPRSGSHPHVAFNEGHRKPSIGKKLSGMFHLGDKEDETSSNAGDAPHHHHRPHMPHFGKHHDANVANTSDSSIGSSSSGQRTDDSISPLTAGKKVPWYRRLFTKKKPMTRSFTMEDLKQDLKMDDHLVPQADLLAKLDVNPETGLSPEEAARRLVKDGKNILTPPKKVPEILKFLHELVGGFSPLLEIGSILCFIAYGLQAGTQSDPPGDNLYLAIVLLCVVLITGGFLYLQKAKSEQIMEGFKNMLPQSAKVLRGGKVVQISAEDVVLGDIVELHGGDRIPADVRILEAKGLKVDNASLTGESEAQSRSTESSENPLESKNLAFYTTNAVEGLGKAVVVRRGDATVMGRIAKLTTRIDTSETTIAREMRHFVILICIFAIVMGGIIFIVAVAIGYGGLYAIILAIGLVVANVPEGIIITVTVMLTLTAKRMAKKNCLIKNLEAVETLGACSVICSDKTGTLTQNRMTVSHCWVDEEIFTMDTISETEAGKNLPDTPTVKDLIRITTLCNRAKFKDDQGDKPIYQRECVGDASETALLKFTEIITGDVAGIRQKNKAVAEIPFNSTNKYAVSIHETDDNGQKGYVLVMKGAPERIWDRCSTVVSHGQNAPKDEEWKQKFQDAYAELGSMGERVLGFALLPLPADKYPYPTEFDVDSKDFPSDGLNFIGLISLIDPPRAAVPDGVAKCRSAGIQVIMVTGDHPLTAKAIARNVGIISETGETVEDIAKRTGVDVKDVNPRDAQAIVIHGTDLKDMSSEQLDDVLKYHSEIVFARTSPQQKLIIVEACQRSGAIVAVTGDGVNDSPALKKANIGIAMGITGSDVSKQAADIVLLDDNFASIVTGIEEGRLIFDNLKKTICYTMMTNIPEIAPVLLYFILSIPLGLTTIPMLLICLGTDMVPSISMAHETAEADIMKMPPRHPDDRLVSGKLIQCCYLQAGMICATGAFFSYFVVLGSCGFWPSRVMNLRDEWEDPNNDDLRDSYGQEWNYAQRMLLQRTVEAAFFAAVVVFQWLDLISRKVRRKSVFQKGMGNWFLNLSLVFETLVTIFCIYVPVLNYALNLNTIRFIWWLPVIPFALYYFLFDELRRYLIRRYPGGWWEKEHYF